MKIGLHIADFTYPAGGPGLADDLTRIVVAAEEAGFQRVSVMDHLFQIQVLGPPEHEMLEAYTTLGYLAARTDEGRAARVGHRRHLPRPGHARQDRHHARRALQGPRLARHRRGLERGGGRRPRPVLPGHGRALRAARGDPADLPADVERRRRALRRQALPARAHPQLAAVAAAAAPADPHRRRRGEEDAADGRAVRRRLQPVPQPGPRAQARRAARALRGRRPRLRRDREDRDVRPRPRREGREGRRAPRPSSSGSRSWASARRTVGCRACTRSSR